ncbi:hypothetical protein K450DRAFT_263711 [Umbelopsis ramanniana AG]|uniref:Uncharacterized protein n=1 Tax=Umbelopsis ramanniana AG TaxID=1314678 RepID=A0AAD5E1Z2_UMBRA|nr:uncharacterized protein K450DRAFT_263711 [Umbelopsis ramanniana AG]KAI8575021.1 hypothetical protein K450DRAFT_263711 [Umbelopsis ramanniana AG]
MLSPFRSSVGLPFHGSILVFRRSQLPCRCHLWRISRSIGHVIVFCVVTNRPQTPSDHVPLGWSFMRSFANCENLALIPFYYEIPGYRSQ